MALSDLIARLERDAEARVQALREKAAAEVAALEAEAARASQVQREHELSSRRAVRRARFEQELADARQRARADRVRAEHTLLSRIFTRARALVPEVGRGPDFAAALRRHLAEALHYVEGVRVVVRCAPEVAPVLVPVLTQRGDAALVEDATLGPGLVVTAADDSVVVDQTLAARLARLEPRLGVELLNTLRPERTEVRHD